MFTTTIMETAVFNKTFTSVSHQIDGYKPDNTYYYCFTQITQPLADSLTFSTDIPSVDSVPAAGKG